MSESCERSRERINSSTDIVQLILSFQGGNDYEIFSDSRTIGHTVNGPEDTMKQLKELFF